MNKTEALGLLGTLLGFTEEDNYKGVLKDGGAVMASYWMELSSEEKSDVLKEGLKGLEVVNKLAKEIEDLLSE